VTAEKRYPTDPAGELDAGAADKRREFCTTRPWCLETAGHNGNCVEIPRAPHERQDWDLRTRAPTGWTEQKRSRGEG